MPLGMSRHKVTPGDVLSRLSRLSRLEVPRAPGEAQAGARDTGSRQSATAGLRPTLTKITALPGAYSVGVP